MTGDGQPDLVVEYDRVPPFGPTRLAVIPLAARRPGTPVPFDSASYDGRPLRVVDLDVDGRADVPSIVDPADQPPRLVWRRSLGEGHLGAEQVIPLELPTMRYRADLLVTDFDLDGVPDVFVDVADTLLGVRQWSLRNDGRGGFEIMFEGGEPMHEGDVLLDVDADGRPDLVSHRDQEPYHGHIVYAIAVRRGDGLGGFLPPLPARWLGFTGSMGRFTTSGARDMVRVGTFGDSSAEGDPFPFGQGRFQLEVLPGAGTVLPADVAPPTVELRVVPPAPGGDPSLVRLATLPVDECASAPRVTRRAIDLVPLGGAAAVAFRPAEQQEILIGEAPSTGRRAVLVRGPDRQSMLAVVEAVRRAGGVPFRHMEPMRLTVDGAWGPPLPELPGMQLVQRFVLRDGVAVEAEVHRPDTDLTFTLTAFDGVREGVTHVALRDVHADP